MGKGTRKKERNIIEAEKRRAEDERRLKKKKRARKTAGIISSIVFGTAVVVLAVILTVTSVINSGSSMRNTVVAETEHYSVNGAMASYYMYSILSDFKSDNSTYLDKMMDTSTSLKDQPCYYEETKTWFDYFAEVTRQRVVLYLSMAEKAYSAGDTEISEENSAAIDKEIENLKKEAQNAGISLGRHLHNTYGRGVKETDVRDALRLYYISYQYRMKCYNNAEASESDIASYCENNKSKFYKASYYSYTISAVYDSKTATEETVNAAVNKAKSEAEAIASGSSVADFLTAVKEHMKANGMTDEEITEAIGKALVADAAYSEADETAKWIFDRSRKPGDATTVKGTEEYTAVCITEPYHKDETVSRDLYDLSVSSDKSGVSDKTYAEELLKDIKEASGNDIDALKKAFSDRGNGDAVLTAYENISDDDVSESIGNWLFSDTRKVGDTTVTETSDGAHILLFVGNGMKKWEQAALSAIKTAAADKVQSNAEKEISPTVYLDRFDTIRI